MKLLSEFSPQFREKKVTNNIRFDDVEESSIDAKREV